MSQVTITLNGEEKTLNSIATIADLIKFYDLDIKKVAIEKDLEVINPEDFSSIKVNQGCKIEIVHFIGGG